MNATEPRGPDGAAEGAAALIRALSPLISRVRTDVTAIRRNGKFCWTREPLTEERLAKHLNGGPARGVCPIKAGESVTMVALLDLDSHKGETSWEQMAEVAERITAELLKRGLIPSPWRSSGGRGIHLIMLWDQPQDAYSVRQALIETLGVCGFKNGTGGVAARQVEVFPKQDAVGIDKFGSQFILPLAGSSVPLVPALGLEPVGRDMAAFLRWDSSVPVPVAVPAPAPVSVSVSVSVPQREAPQTVPRVPMMLEQRLLHRALQAINNDAETGPDRDGWFRLLCAFKEGGGDREVARAWSKQHPSWKSDREFDGPWNSIKVGKPGGVPVSHLIRVAEEQGFNELKTLEFDDQKQPAPVSTASEWPRPVDLFTQHPVPTFPIQAVPDSLAKHAASLAAQSGFDQGAYVYALLLAASGWIDQRARLAITDSFRVPAYLWGGLVDPSGGGKSPVISAAAKFIKAIDVVSVKASNAMLQQWQVAKDMTPKGERLPPRPTWRQRIVLDATVEAVADLLEDNPQGLVMLADEITEVVGRMDAYSSGSGQGGSKDRGVFIRLFDGTSSTINRKSGHTFLEHASLAMLAGIQPEKLAELFRKSASGGADGLYQRFLCFSMRPATKADYEALVDHGAEAGVSELFERLDCWTQDGTFFQTTTLLSPQARALANDYQNDIRLVAERTPARRLREHMNKFPGLLGRVAFTLHCIECAAHGLFRREVEASTMERALQVMAVMFRHAEAVYSVLDTTTSDVQDLVRSAGELVLSKNMSEFKRGDLTRGATGWQSAAAPVAEAAIDLLIDFDWIREAIGAEASKRRGRRPMGTFVVNPQVHELFAEKSKRIRAVRRERHAAIQRVGAQRVDLDKDETVEGHVER